jgi:hypothetical protein
MSVYLTPEDLAALTAFAQDDGSPIEPEQVERLVALHHAVERNVLKNLTGLRKRNAMLNERLERIREKDRLKISVEDFAETGLDSVEVAKALLYQLQQRKTFHRLTKSKLIAILYWMYASYLYHQQERIFLEHAKASPQGPTFWKVYNAIRTTVVPVEYKDWENICKKNAGVAAFCKEFAERFYNDDESDIINPLLKSQPYKNADKDHNGGKWSKEIADKEIYAWKEAMDYEKKHGKKKGTE